MIWFSENLKKIFYKCQWICIWLETDFYTYIYNTSASYVCDISTIDAIDSIAFSLHFNS